MFGVAVVAEFFFIFSLFLKQISILDRFAKKFQI